MNAIRRINWTFLIVATVVRGFLLAAAAGSFMHIVEAAHKLGLHGWEAYSTPFLIDGFAILGMIGRSSKFSAQTNSAGLKLMAGAGFVSLAANVYAGSNRGEQAYGVLIVVGFLVAEWYSAKLIAAAPVAELAPVHADVIPTPAITAAPVVAARPILTVVPATAALLPIVKATPAPKARPTATRGTLTAKCGNGCKTRRHTKACQATEASMVRSYM